MSYFPAFSVQQSVVASTLNSSNDNLDAGATFTGTGESTLNVAGIQVTIHSTQNCTVYVDQSKDNSNWDVVSLFEYVSSLGGDGWTVQAQSNYFRVRVTNNGLIATGHLRLLTCLCPIVEALPRSVDNNGNLKVGIKSISDSYGFSAECTPIDQLRVAQSFRLVGAVFSGTTLDSNFWTPTTANGGTVTQANANAVLRTNTTSAGSAILQSVRTARYIGGTGIFARMVIQNDAPTSTNTRRWGIFNATDGAFFELNGATLNVVTRKTGSPSAVASGSFNGKLGSSYVVDTNVHTYEIYWTNSKVYFVIGGTVLHTVSASAATWVDTMHHPLRFENVNGAITTDLMMYVRVATIQRLGVEETAPIWKNIHGAVTAQVLKYGPGRLKKIIYNTTANGSTVTLYDALTATNPIAIITPPNSVLLGSIPYDLDFYTGLTITTVNAATDITVVYE